ncbi:MAG: hypothetical protein K0S38_199 [Candidatus Paceibacter sp.]|jgi:hypothetical protein|nr:hypothetical protein [Candidatus Paceibacter sp.]
MASKTKNLDVHNETSDSLLDRQPVNMEAELPSAEAKQISEAEVIPVAQEVVREVETHAADVESYFKAQEALANNPTAFEVFLEDAEKFRQVGVEAQTELKAVMPELQKELEPFFYTETVTPVVEAHTETVIGTAPQAFTEPIPVEEHAAIETVGQMNSQLENDIKDGKLDSKATHIATDDGMPEAKVVDAILPQEAQVVQPEPTPTPEVAAEPSPAELAARHMAQMSARLKAEEARVKAEEENEKDLQEKLDTIKAEIPVAKKATPEEIAAAKLAQEQKWTEEAAVKAQNFAKSVEARKKEVEEKIEKKLKPPAFVRVPTAEEIKQAVEEKQEVGRNVAANINAAFERRKEAQKTPEVKTEKVVPPEKVPQPQQEAAPEKKPEWRRSSSFVSRFELIRKIPFMGRYADQREIAHTKGMVEKLEVKSLKVTAKIDVLKSQIEHEQSTEKKQNLKEKLKKLESRDGRIHAKMSVYESRRDQLVKETAITNQAKLDALNLRAENRRQDIERFDQEIATSKQYIAEATKKVLAYEATDMTRQERKTHKKLIKAINAHNKLITSREVDKEKLVGKIENFTGKLSLLDIKNESLKKIVVPAEVQPYETGDVFKNISDYTPDYSNTSSSETDREVSVPESTPEPEVTPVEAPVVEKKKKAVPPPIPKRAGPPPIPKKSVPPPIPVAPAPAPILQPQVEQTPVQPQPQPELNQQIPTIQVKPESVLGKKKEKKQKKIKIATADTKKSKKVKKIGVKKGAKQSAVPGIAPTIPNTPQ